MAGLNKRTFALIAILCVVKKTFRHLKILNIPFIQIKRILTKFSTFYCNHQQIHKQNEETSIISLTSDSNNDNTPTPTTPKYLIDNQAPKGPLIAFTGAGMLWAYYIGIVSFLRDHFDIHTSNISLSGISCGTMAASMMFLDLSIQQGFELGLACQKLFDNRFCKFMFISTSFVLNEIMNKIHKFGINDKVLANKYKKYDLNSIHFGATAVTKDGLSHLCMNNFESIKQMFYSSLCSMRTVPFFRTPGFYNGYYVLDGAFSSKYTIPENYKNYQDKIIYISSAPSYSADIKPMKTFKLNEWCSSGGINDNLDRFNKGYKDAAKYMAIVNCVEKGLIWKHTFDYNNLYTQENENELKWWNSHVNEKIEEWNHKITTYINNQS